MENKIPKRIWTERREGDRTILESEPLPDTVLPTGGIMLPKDQKKDALKRTMIMNGEGDPTGIVIEPQDGAYGQVAYLRAAPGRRVEVDEVPNGTPPSGE